MDVFSPLNKVSGHFLKFLSTLKEKQNALEPFAERSIVPNLLGEINGTLGKIICGREAMRVYGFVLSL